MLRGGSWFAKLETGLKGSFLYLAVYTLMKLAGSSAVIVAREAGDRLGPTTSARSPDWEPRTAARVAADDRHARHGGASRVPRVHGASSPDRGPTVDGD